MTYVKPLVLLLMLFAASSWAIPDADVKIHRFRLGDEYVAEISLYVIGASLTCSPMLSSEYGVDYTVIITDDQSHLVVGGNRYRLTSKHLPPQDLIDVRRFALPSGLYTIDVEVTDIADSLNTITIRNQINIDAGDLLNISDPQLLSVLRPVSDDTSSLNKSGLYLEPLPFNYYYQGLDQLNVYIETYNTDELTGQPYLQYTIQPAAGDIPSPVIAHRKVLRQAASANVFQFDIASLITGRYLLETELFDGNKSRIAGRSIYFERYNPAGDSVFLAQGTLNLDASFVKRIPVDSLDYYLRAMAPVVSSMHNEMLNVLLLKGNSKAKQFFIHRHWTEEAGKFAEQAFSSYMKVAKAVDAMYRSGFGYGFETDRGHIFLKYGRPDDIIAEEDEPSAPPYEIWYYNHFPATKQSNVRFLFYNPSLANNAFRLLHSTAIGEVKNERWEVELYRDATLETPGVNEKVMGDNVHRNARKYFERF